MREVARAHLVQICTRSEAGYGEDLIFKNNLTFPKAGLGPAGSWSNHAYREPLWTGPIMFISGGLAPVLFSVIKSCSLTPVSKNVKRLERIGYYFKHWCVSQQQTDFKVIFELEAFEDAQLGLHCVKSTFFYFKYTGRNDVTVPAIKLMGLWSG